MPTGGRKLTLLFATLAVVVLGVAGWIGWPWVQFWWRFEALGLNDQGLPEYRHRMTGIIMVRLPGGTFWMGAQKEDPRAAELAGPAQEVTLPPFLIGKYEVTQAEWKRVMTTNPSIYKGNDLPVESAHYVACQEFCRKTGLSLPSELQWEYACAGGRDDRQDIGESPGVLDRFAWFPRQRNWATRPVGQENPNEFGLYDTLGNVFEWCADVRPFTPITIKVGDPVWLFPRSGDPTREPLAPLDNVGHVVAPQLGVGTLMSLSSTPRTGAIGFRPAAPCP